jgi:hypothetical protein
LTTNLPATDAAIALLEKFHQDPTKVLAGFLSLRFTSATPASVSMSFSADKASPGRCYMEIFSLFNFFKSIQGFDDLLAPLSEQSIDKFQVRYISFFAIINPVLPPSPGPPALGPVYYPIVHNAPVRSI